MFHGSMLQEGTIKCPKCKYTIRGESNFCFYCGTPIDELATEPKLKTKKLKD